MKVFVVGAGSMGSGIAQVFAKAQIDVYLCDIKQEYLDKGMQLIQKDLNRMVGKGKIEQSAADELVTHIMCTTDYMLAANADLIVEAIIENMAAKKELLQRLEPICSEGTIFATNTSSLSITEIASALQRPSNAVGMHFFNPAPVMELIEVVRGMHTSDETFKSVRSLCEKIGKKPVEVKEYPGFVVNRLLIPMINEAVGLLAEGVASAQDIDDAMKKGANHPMGPLALADLIGNDVVLAIMNTLLAEFEDSKYRAHPLLKKMVRARMLGRKTSIGFYQY